MPLNEQAKNVIERPLPKEKIKQRPGKAGMTYDYVTPDFIISLLNEAFDYRWNTVITHRTMVADTAVVELQLTVWDAENQAIVKTQYGSCDVGRGMGPGEAFKGAASDAMKKAATLLGVALELYGGDETPKQQFQEPTKATRPSAPPAPPAPPSPAATPPAPPAPPKPVAAATPTPPTAPTPAAPAPAATPPKPAAGPQAPPKPINPFANGGTAKVPKPTPPPNVASKQGVPPPPKAASVPKTNPFESHTTASGPNSTQINALNALAGKKDLSPPDMIALAEVVDELGHPKQAYDDLSHAEAIQVIKASQL